MYGRVLCELLNTAGKFVEALAQWRGALGVGLRGQARLLKCSPSLLVFLDAGDRQPTSDFMARCIATADEPWKSLLKQARQADQEAADREAADALAVAV